MNRRALFAAVLAMLWVGAMSCSQESTVAGTDVQITDEDGFKKFKFRILNSEFRPFQEGGEVLVVWFGGRWNGRDTAMRLTLDLLWEAPKQEPPVFPVWLGLVGFVGAPKGAAFVQEFANALGEGSRHLSGVEGLVLETVTLGEKPSKQTRKFQNEGVQKI